MIHIAKPYLGKEEAKRPTIQYLLAGLPKGPVLQNLKKNLQSILVVNMQLHYRTALPLCIWQ